MVLKTAGMAWRGKSIQWVLIRFDAKNLKVVDKAMALPLVSSAYSEVSRVTSPYVESTLNKVSPMMETTWSKVTPVMATVKTQVEEKVIPIIPSKVSETVQNVQTAAVDNITAAVEKVN